MDGETNSGSKIFLKSTAVDKLLFSILMESSYAIGGYHIMTKKTIKRTSTDLGLNFYSLQSTRWRGHATQRLSRIYNPCPQTQ
jgi:hypothetical protein